MAIAYILNAATYTGCYNGVHFVVTTNSSGDITGYCGTYTGCSPNTVTQVAMPFSGEPTDPNMTVYFDEVFYPEMMMEPTSDQAAAIRPLIATCTEQTLVDINDINSTNASWLMNNM